MSPAESEGGSGTLRGKNDLKDRSGDPAFGVDAVSGKEHAAMLADDAFGSGKAKAGAAGVEAGGGEGLEEPREDIGIDAGTVV